MEKILHIGPDHLSSTYDCNQNLMIFDYILGNFSQMISCMNDLMGHTLIGEKKIQLTHCIFDFSPQMISLVHYKAIYTYLCRII